MTQTVTSIATAADYADAMLTARRAKGWLFVVLLLVLLAQLAVFFVVAYGPAETTAYAGGGAARIAAGDVATTQPAVVEPVGSAAGAVAVSPARTKLSYLLEYLIDGSTFIGMGTVFILAVVLLLIVLIMLIGRLIGVARLTSAFVWCVVLIVLLLPWQALLTFEGSKPGAKDPDFRIPGVLMNWSELAFHGRDTTEPGVDLAAKILKWSRFVGFPVAALLVLLIVNTKANRGLRLALGEADTDPTIEPTR
jgi:hypothetical protein